jgi:hypothetical protein
MNAPAIVHPDFGPASLRWPIRRPSGIALNAGRPRRFRGDP